MKTVYILLLPIVGLLMLIGLKVRYLDQSAIEALTRWVLNLNLEYRSS
ncbi:MAG TPA: hypothetical protein VLT51_04770 [Anaerolineales bacterium]|nr:hypothetical protein [Anaerolineales bacterium]